MDNSVYQSLNNYFMKLKSTGSSTYKEKTNLMILTWLGNIYDNYSDYITTEDQKTINKILSCLSNNVCEINI